MTVRKLKWKVRWLMCASFLSSILPLAVVFLLKRTEYVATMGQTVKLGAGCVIVLILLLLKVLGKLKVPSRVTVFTMAFVLSYLLAPILDDMMLLSGAALVGEAIDSMFFLRLIEKTKEQIRIEENATATADKVEVVLKTYLGGRV
jgi:hypothetical protein